VLWAFVIHDGLITNNELSYVVTICHDVLELEAREYDADDDVTSHANTNSVHSVTQCVEIKGWPNKKCNLICN
jgi:hypothetical protein